MVVLIRYITLTSISQNRLMSENLLKNLNPLVTHSKQIMGS